MSDVVINLNFGPRVVSVPVETRQRALEIEPQGYQLEPEAIRYLIYEGLTPLDIFQYRAAAKGKGKAGKQCKTGQACGNTCISKTKTCKNGLSGATKEKAWKAKKKTGSKAVNDTFGQGKALAELGQKLDQSLEKQKSVSDGKAAIVLVRKAKQDANPNGDAQERIDKKYASTDPSDRDVNRWLAESVRLNAKDTPENIERLAAMNAFYSATFGQGASSPYLPLVKDEQSFIDAYVSFEKAKRGKQELEYEGKRYSPDAVEFWMANLSYSPEVSEAKRVLDNPKIGAKRKEKAQKLIDEHERRVKEEYPDIAKQQRDNWLKRGSKESLEAEAKQKYNSAIEENRKSVKTIISSYNKDKNDDARQGLELFSLLSVGHPPGGEMFGFSFGKSQTDTVKDYLRSKSPDSVAGKYLGNPKSKAQLKKVFREFATKNHPDVGGDTALFQSVSARYQEMLSNLP